MSEHPVYWHEGMFLTPHQFQAADRWQAREQRLGSQWDQHYNWGARVIDLDHDALANQRLVIRRLRGRMRDGTQVCFPEDGSLAVLDVKPALLHSETAIVYLGLPLENPAQPAIGDAGRDLTARYNVDLVEATDANTGADAQSIKVLRPNARLLIEGEDLSGYEVLPVMRVRRSDALGGGAEIDAGYIPPILACDAWPPLRVGVLTQLLERLEKKAEVLAGQAVARDLSFDSQGQGERLLLEQLRVLQEVVALLAIDVTAQGVAPLLAYRELARLVGRLSVFSPEKKLRQLPPYDHDQLGPCFQAAKQAVIELLEAVAVATYEERVFTADGMTLRVDLDPRWLESGRQLLLGVESSLAPEEAEQLLASGSDMKFGCGKRADSLFLHGEAGLEPRRLSHTPRALPVRRGLAYYSLAATAAPDVWRGVERSLTLAARVSEHLLVDELADHHAVVIDVDGKSATFKLSLFVLHEPANLAADQASIGDTAVLAGV